MRINIFKALADEKRLRILEHLQRGEKCACFLTDDLGIAQSALSYHMKILCESGFVKKREEGKWTHYSISKHGSEKAIQVLKEITDVINEEAYICPVTGKIKEKKQKAMKIAFHQKLQIKNI
eukprot:TRINITY_DN5251_c0_g1_i3.p2 TRINITY_DN5251_c0_g1~~TRINITY_DN5251_c0_g1_i3.p2  ORF type:complete len:122 (+),score=11.49 TRINITY_DN5251_c0_g1_i3:237-602(+)